MTIEQLGNRELRAVILGAQALERITDSAEFYASVLPLLLNVVRSADADSEKELAVLEAIRPFLARAHERVTSTPHLCSGEELGLTPRQAQVLEHLAAGRSCVQIAQAMGISERTVQKHLEHIYSRLHVPSRSAAVALALGLAHPS